MVRLENARHRQVGRQRQGRVLLLGLGARAKAQLQPPVHHRHLLLGRIDPRGPAPRLGRGDPRGQVGEPRGQVGGRHGLVGQLGAAGDHRPLHALQRDLAVRADPHGEHHRRPRAIGQQARGPFAQHRRIEPGLGAGHVGGGPAPPGLLVDRAAVLDEPGDVGDGVVQQEVRPARLDGEGLVEVGRAGRVQGHERPVRPVGMLARPALRRRLGGRQHLRRKRSGNLVAAAELGHARAEGVVGVDEGFHASIIAMA